MHYLAQDLCIMGHPGWLIHSHSYTSLWSLLQFCENSKNSENFEVPILNIRIGHDLTQDLFWVIPAKFQSHLITSTAVSFENSKYSEIWISIIRIVHDLNQDLWVIHEKFQSLLRPWFAKMRNIRKNSKLEVRILIIRRPMVY